MTFLRERGLAAYSQAYVDTLLGSIEDSMWEAGHEVAR